MREREIGRVRGGVMGGVRGRKIIENRSGGMYECVAFRLRLRIRAKSS